VRRGAWAPFGAAIKKLPQLTYLFDHLLLPTFAASRKVLADPSNYRKYLTKVWGSLYCPESDWQPDEPVTR
jgi:hypothetical protein